MLAGKQPVIPTAIFASIRSQAGQVDAMNVLAKATLDERRQDILRSVLEVYKKASSSRNKIAHWLWGGARGIENAVILVDPAAYSLNWAHIRTRHAPEKKQSEDEKAARERLYRRMFVYREQDFRDASQKITTAYRVVDGLATMLGTDLPLDAHGWNNLLSDPDLQRELDALDKRRQKS